MEIVYFFKDYKVPMYQWQHVHIINELKTHDCNITIVSPLDYESPKVANEALLKYMRSHRVDLFMTPHNEKDLYIDTLEQIKKLSVPTLLICFDNLIVPFVHYIIAPHFDLVWLTSKETKNLFDKRGCRTIFLPYAANPSLPMANESINGIGFVGTPYGSRANMINILTQNGVPVYCHCLKEKDSNGEMEIQLPQSGLSSMNVALQFMKFPQGRKVIEGALVNKFKKNATLEENSFLHKEQIVPPEKLYQVYPRYSLALSSTTARNTGVLKHPLDIVNLRSFEIPMSGGLQICQYSDEMASYFDEGKEVVFYRSYEELLDKAKYYCAKEREGERMQMRIAARLKAVNNHTWYKRFVTIFEYFGLNE